MCGIAGLFELRSSPKEENLTGMALRMIDTLIHRGPDGGDVWSDAEAGVSLGHRRLAIVDLSETGAQPMHSADSRYVISYNGEVYNFLELRAELAAKGHRFRGTSDTEVMLAAIAEWGPVQAIRRFAGMFAFALFDRQTRTLFLVRDRLGVKPLYWSVAGGTLLFGSELRALMAHPSFRKDINRDAVDALVRYSYIPAPATVFQGVFKLPAGTILTARAGEDCSAEAYWTLADHIPERTRVITDAEAHDELDRLLQQSVRQRMIADVPLGAFLSGGFDSATVVALMQATSSRPVRTYTIGFEDAAYNESDDARAVADRIGTDHTEITLNPNAALDLVDRIPDWFDEPFADSSQLPTYLVSYATRQHVTVALSGDGGDELFAGYPKYALLDRIWKYAGPAPNWLRIAAATIMTRIPESALRTALAGHLDAGRAERIGEKVRRLASALRSLNRDEAARALSAVGLDHDIVPGASRTIAPPLWSSHSPDDLVSRMQAQDTVGYLPDDILTKLDRCSMSASLESREPLLDHRVVEFVWSLPLRVRHCNGRHKGLLRAVLDRYVQPGLPDRPKRGFSVPLDQWLAGPLREWADDLLSPQTLGATGIFDVSKTRTIWTRHCSGKEGNATGLWNVLMVQAWSQRWL
jgi:asparagine synthase (glutamine-hydrolysing)